MCKKENKLKQVDHNQQRVWNYGVIKMIRLKADESIEFMPSVNKLIFITKGECSLATGKYQTRSVHAPSMLLLPIGRHTLVKAEANTGVTLIIAYLRFQYSINDILNKNAPIRIHKKKGTKTDCLHIHRVMQRFLNELRLYLAMGFSSPSFMELKTREFVILLKEFYKDEELIDFFTPIIDEDQVFTDFINMNYQKVNTITELAHLACYSFSGFEKRFKRVFGMTASQWLRQKKDAYH